MWCGRQERVARFAHFAKMRVSEGGRWRFLRLVSLCLGRGTPAFQGRWQAAASIFLCFFFLSEALWKLREVVQRGKNDKLRCGSVVLT